MSQELKMFHFALLNLYNDMDNEKAIKMVKLAWHFLDYDEKDVINLTANADVASILIEAQQG